MEGWGRVEPTAYGLGDCEQIEESTKAVPKVGRTLSPRLADGQRAEAHTRTRTGNLSARLHVL